MTRVSSIYKIFSLLIIVSLIMINASNQLPSKTTDKEVELFQSIDLVDFNKTSAWEYLVQYMSFSPITPGSVSNSRFIQNISKTLDDLSWEVYLQNWTHTNDVNLTNILAKKNSNSSNPLIIIGAHYDARLWADKDQNLSLRNSPVPAANDGGSGVAILLELARAMTIPTGYEVWLVFFDAEDQGGITNWEGGYSGWIIGSTYFVAKMQQTDVERTKFMILLDLVGSEELIIKKEASSNQVITAGIWECAEELGYQDTFVNQIGLSIIDDHFPFSSRGIPAVDIIQQQSRDGYAFFKWHHTTNDTIENVDPDSLELVGRTVEYFVEKQPYNEGENPIDLSLIFIGIGILSIGIIIGIIFYYKKKREKKI
ncbi:MAG: M28 family peptidase [Candidatus Ranarchaeia archaeon]